ncbi:MAG TPA: class I SAM-dependent methyltransferase [Gemmatimonadales bacterium]|nr:class I SAM-dependent methyltransferase [Gemmatimonadales bacterium]
MTDRVARVRAVFDEWARGPRADDMAASHAPVARVALDRLRPGRDARFLDIGCGNGYVVRWAAEAAPDGLAVGIDVSPDMITLARRHSTGHANARFEVADIAGPTTPTALAAASFDAIFSMEVFYYLPDLDAALRRTLDLLRPGGRFACAVDYYGENTASHSWPSDLGVAMTLLDQAGWKAAFGRAGFVNVRQERIRQAAPTAAATEVAAHGPSADWKVTQGTLLTLGERA